MTAHTCVLAKLLRHQTCRSIITRLTLRSHDFQDTGNVLLSFWRSEVLAANFIRIVQFTCVITKLHHGLQITLEYSSVLADFARQQHSVCTLTEKSSQFVIQLDIATEQPATPPFSTSAQNARFACTDIKL